MPKAPPSVPSATIGGRASAQNVLKRNQACHQCRKKKLKCDAQSPCSACVKTHTYAMKTHPTTAPPFPECTYDNTGGEDPLQAARMMELEAKIQELEGKLKSQPNQSTQPNPSPQIPVIWPTSAPGSSAAADFIGVSAIAPSFSNNHATISSASPDSSRLQPSPIPSPPGTSQPSSSSFSLFSSVQSPGTSISAASPASVPRLIPDTRVIFTHFTDGPPGPTPASPPVIATLPGANPGSTGSLNSYAVLEPNWPNNIPPPELLHHLVDTFFTCVPMATRVLHKPSFMTGLLESPTSLKFPLTPLLHAICAIASVYTPVVTNGTEKDQIDIGPDTLFASAIAEKRDKYDGRDSCIKFDGMAGLQVEEGNFGMMHAQWYEHTWLNCARRGDRLVQLLQAAIVITWYYHSVGRAVDVWVAMGNCCRTVLPMGLNCGPLWTPVSRQPVETLSMFPCTASETEKELVRNLFWLVFSMERVFCAGTVWPLTLQDDDTTQYLPLSTTTLAHKFIHYSERQRLSTPRVLVIHPPSITDSFTLYIKSTILLGKVKTFNGRFKNKFDEGMPEGLDPRETAEFQMLDNAITSFKLSFPKEYREPVTAEGKLDPTLYLALVLPHVAMLLLHDPHARPESPNCLSAERMLTSARAILDLIYKLTATSFDLLLLDHSCSFCWFVCATALIRFLKAKMIAGDEVETTRLTNEIQVVRFMLSNLGSRTIVGLRQNIILDEMYQAEVQPLIDKVVGVSNMGGGASGMFGVF